MVWVVTVCLAAGVFVGQWQRARWRPVEPEPPAMARAVLLALTVAALTILAVGLAAGSRVAWDLTAEY